MIRVRPTALLFLVVTALVSSAVQAAHPATAPLPTGRWYASAARADGKVFLFGGFGCSANACTTFDAYDPQSNTWTTLGLTFNARLSLVATTGPDGRVYAFGGQGDGNGNLLEVIRGR